MPKGKCHTYREFDVIIIPTVSVGKFWSTFQDVPFTDFEDVPVRVESKLS